jgi:hypothetical protein
MIRRMNTCSAQVCHEHVFESPLGHNQPIATQLSTQ